MLLHNFAKQKLVSPFRTAGFIKTTITIRVKAFSEIIKQVINPYNNNYDDSNYNNLCCRFFKLREMCKTTTTISFFIIILIIIINVAAFLLQKPNINNNYDDENKCVKGLRVILYNNNDNNLCFCAFIIKT